MSNITLSSTTSSAEELEHAAGPNWREPFVPKESPAAQENEPETPATSETAETTESGKPEPAAKKSGWEKRIDKLTARNADLAKRLEDALKARSAESKPAPEQPKNLAPQLKDYKTPEDWADARDAWKSQQAEEAEKATEARAVFDEYNVGLETTKIAHDDFDDVVTNNNSLHVYNEVQLAIIEMGKLGSEVAYYLGTHPEVCESLMEVRPLTAVGKIHEIAKSLGQKESRSPEAKPRTVAPKPITPVGASATRSSVPLDQLSPAEFIRVRNRQEADRRR